jgi:hypothetical protein
MNPYAPPGDPTPGTKRGAGGGRYSARLEGDARETLVVSRDAELPSVCLKCGSHADIMRRTTPLQWTPVWARFLMFCVIGLVIMLVTTKRATLQIPLCVPCNARWAAARKASVVGVVAIVGAFIAMRTMDDPMPGLVILGLAVAGFVAFSISFVRPRTLRVKRIDEREIHLADVHPSAAREVVEGSS